MMHALSALVSTTALALLAAPLAAQHGNALQFTDATMQSGVAFLHTDGPDTMAGGVCLFDWNDDGFPDVFASARGQGQCRLYENKRNGTFADVTAAAGLLGAAEAMGACAGDLDNDGRQELLVLQHGRVNLYRNDGNGKMLDVTAASGIENNGLWATACSFGDYDRDGRLDVYIGNYVADGFFPYFDGGRNRLWHNEGGLQFTDRSRAAGVEGFETFRDPRGFDRSTYSCTLSALFWDYDRDGWPDIFVGNDFGPFVIPDQLYRNNRDGTFSLMAASAGFRIAEFNMGLATADVNGDLIPDLYTTNLGDNHLLLNDGRGRLHDVSSLWGAQEGVSNGKLLTSWACMFFDADLDGLRDLYVANGYIQTVPAMDNDRFAPSRMLRNLGRSFAIVPSQNLFWDTGVGRGGATGDLDGDGDEDVVLLNNKDWLRIYRNVSTGPAGSATLDLIGTASNRDAVGAYVVARTRQFAQALDHVRGGSYVSCNAAPIVLGLGVDPRIEELTVRWPSGIESRLLWLEGGRRHEVREPLVTVRAIGAPRPIGTGYIEIPVTLKNHTGQSEPVGFAAHLTWNQMRGQAPVYAFPVRLGAHAEATVSVFLPIPYALLPAARAAGIWLQLAAHSARGARDETRVPF